MRAAVNLPAGQFGHRERLISIEAVGAEAGIAPRFVEIQLTESLIMMDVDQAVRILNDLKRLGVTLSIDDFSTGCSSLAYLKSFPLDILKIDRSFMANVKADSNDAAIVASIISLAHNRRLKVIVEGVETGEQLAYLRHLGCDQMQGDYSNRPVAFDGIAALMRLGQEL